MATQKENIEMLALGFKVVVEAPTEEQASKAMVLVKKLSGRMPEADVETAKQIFSGKGDCLEGSE